MEHQQFFASLEEEIRSALELWHCPSAALGVIWDGEIQYAGGIGLRDREAGLPADSRTLYQIGSSSKSFTAMLCAMLVDRGELSWDEPLRTWMPEIRFVDPFTTANVTPRDLLCHRTGLPRHEYAWYRTPFTREELVHNLRYLEPNLPFRAQMRYNNFGYVLLGALIERVTGMTWENCLKKYILDPLGLVRTTPYLGALEADEDHAAPYGLTGKSLSGDERGQFYRCPEDPEKGLGAPYGPAGSICSCVEDMLRYLRFQLGDGTWEGATVLSPAAFAEMHRPNIFLSAPLDMPMEETILHSYAMGWITELYRGHKVVQHGGNVDGFSAQLFMAPDEKLGIVVLTNMDGCFLHLSIARTVTDHFLGVESGDWFRRYHGFAVENTKGLDELLKRFTGERREGTHPGHPLEEYAGRFTRPGYGPCAVELRDGELVLLMLGSEIRLEHFHYDTFVTRGILGELPPGFPVHFHTAEIGGAVDAVLIPLVPEAAERPIRFERVPEKE